MSILDMALASFIYIPKGSIYCPFKNSGSKNYTWYGVWNQSP